MWFTAIFVFLSILFSYVKGASDPAGNVALAAATGASATRVLDADLRAIAEDAVMSIEAAPNLPWENATPPRKRRRPRLKQNQLDFSDRSA